MHCCFDCYQQETQDITLRLILIKSIVIIIKQILTLFTGCDASVTLSSTDQLGSTGGTTSGSEYGSDYDMKDSGPHSGIVSQRASPNGGLDIDLANYKMPHVEQWLALRVHGGARGWPKLPSCFQPSTSQM